MTESIPSAEQRAQRLAELLAGQLALYRRIKELSAEQNEWIEQGDTAKLMSLLSEKQKVIEEIESLGREVEPLRTAWEQEKEDLSAEARRSVEQAVTDLRETLEEIVALEDQGQGALGQARDSTGESLTKLQKGRALHRAYGGGKKPPPPAHFKDRNG